MRDKIIKYGQFTFLVPFLLIPFADNLFAYMQAIPFTLYTVCWIISIICFILGRTKKYSEKQKGRMKKLLIFATIIILFAIQVVIMMDYSLQK